MFVEINGHRRLKGYRDEKTWPQYRGGESVKGSGEHRGEKEGER